MRCYDEIIEVDLAPAETPGSGDEDRTPSGAASPRAFLWRGRLYVVRAVLGHWYERTAWWRFEATGEHPDEGTGVDGGLASRSLQDEIWRVEAGAGRMAGTGVYDLVRGQSWRLARVAD